MGEKARRIGILGGTFNPVHIGHLLIATFALEEKGFDEVLFVPCFLPPHKVSRDLASGEDRLRMIELAVESNPHFAASDLELKLGGRSYSIRTVERLRDLFGRDSRFSFIIGSDSLYEISSWREVERLAGLCDFITVARTGYPLEQLSAEKLSIGEALFGRLARGIIRTPCIDISSTMIRERVGAGRSIEYMVPAAVADYIERKGLYREGGQESETQ